MVLVMSHIQESSPLEKTRSTESMSSSAIKIVAQSSPTDTGCKKFSIANILGFRKQDDFRAFLTKNVEKNQWNSDFVELVEKDESSSSKVEQSDMNFNTKAHQDSVIQRKNDQELNDDQSEHESDKDALNKSENPFKNQFCVPMKSDECGLLSTSMLRPETNIFSIQKWPSVFSNANSGLHPTWRFWQDIALRQPSTNYSNYLSSQGYRFQPYINRQRGMKPTPPETNTTKHIHYSSTKLCIEKNSSNPEDSQNPDKAHPQKQIKSSKEAVDVLDSSDMFALEAILTKSNDFESGQSVKDSPTVEKKNIRRSSSRISNSSSCSCSDSSFPNNNSDDDALTAAMCSKPVEKNDMSNTNFTEPRKKKTRTVFSRNQIFQLESTFDMKRYLSSSERAGLAASLNLTETQIKIWFQNRRNKWKRQVASDVDGIPYATTMPANSFNVNSLQQHSSQRNHRPAILHRGTFNHQTVGNSSAQFPTLPCLGNERHLFQWPGMKLSPNIEMARNIGSAFSYYPRAMMAAAVAAATASGGGLCYGTGEIRNTFSNSNVTNHLRQDHTLKNEQSDNSFSTNGIK